MYWNVAVLVIALISTFVLVDSFSCRSEVTQVKRYNLNIVIFVPQPDDDFNPAFDKGYSIIPAVEMAIEQINKRTDILPYFHLNLNVKDAGCDKASKTAIETVSVLRDLVKSRNGPVAIIGPACSEDSVFVANTFNRVYNLTVLYSGTTPYLSEHAEDTPNAFGMVSSAAVLTDTLIRIAIEEKWNWENIAVLYDNSREHYQDVYDALVRGLNGSQQVGYTRQIALSQIPLADIVARNIRIVVVLSDKEPSRQLACLAGQSTVNFVFPVRQFIFIEKSLEDFLGDQKKEFLFTQDSDGKKYYCDEQIMLRGLNGSVMLNQALDSVDPSELTVSNYTAGQIKQQYKQRLVECGNTLNVTLPETSHAYPYYDAMWAFAIGFHIGLNSGDPLFGSVHDAILNNVSFQGVSSWIEFGGTGDRHVSNPVSLFQIDVNLLQINYSASEVIGTTNQSYLAYAANTFINDEFETMQVVLHPVLIALGFLTSSLSLLVTIILQVMNTYFRDCPSVKASSSRLNHFIFVGSYLIILAVFVSTLRNIMPSLSGVVLCNGDIICAILGYCMVFSTIFAKSWRTYRIFNHPFKSQRFLQDSTLSILILLFTFFEVLLFIPEIVVSPFDKHVSFNFDTNQWPIVRTLTTTCVADSVGYIALPLLFQFILTFATVFLASLNRNIKHKNFRTTRQIITLAYLLAIVWLTGGPLLVVFYLLDYSINLIYLIYVSLLALTIILCQHVLIVPVLVPAINTKWKLTSQTHPRSWLIFKGGISRDSKTDLIL